MPKPSKRTSELWDEFAMWLKEKNVITICDFNKMRNSQYLISSDRKDAKEIKENATKVHGKGAEICWRKNTQKQMRQRN